MAGWAWGRPAVPPDRSPLLFQLYYIISFLPVRDLVALGQTCRYFYEVCDSEGVWKRICRRLSPRLRDENSGGSQPWKRLAILNCQCSLV